jgi:hypothetical protein
MPLERLPEADRRGAHHGIDETHRLGRGLGDKRNREVQADLRLRGKQPASAGDLVMGSLGGAIERIA